jgi:hypothetical protein
MNTSSHDFITVDMRGLKAALVARAQAERVSVSLLVRSAVAGHLGLAAAAGQLPVAASTSCATIKLSIRLTPAEAQQLAAGALAAGLSRGAYLSGLVSGVPVLTAGAGRIDHLAALHASNAELSTLSRNIHQLTSLLSQVNVTPAQQYRVMLDTLTGDVRRHLMQASRVLADLQPGRRSA